MVQQVPLRNQKGDITGYALVDDKDYEEVMKYKWRKYVNQSTVNFAKEYATTMVERSVTLMHILLIGKKDGMVIDHINGNGLDNQRSNLRFATHAQNAQNRRMITEGHTSQYRGVRIGHKGTWKATIGGEHIGVYQTEIDAAKAYDKRAIELYGPLAFTNGLISPDLVDTIVIKPKRTERDLPKNIKKQYSKYYVGIQWNGTRYESCHSTLEEAQEALDDYKTKLSKLQHDYRYSKEITRNCDGIAILKGKIISTNEIVDILVDDDIWYEFWDMSVFVNTSGYAAIPKDNKHPMLHRYVMNCTSNDGKIVDHINRNRLDNRRCNLRFADVHANAHNVSSEKEFRGVGGSNGRSLAMIRRNGKTWYVGTYPTPIEAAIAYNLCAIKLYDTFASINNICNSDIDMYMTKVCLEMEKLENLQWTRSDSIKCVQLYHKVFASSNEENTNTFTDVLQNLENMPMTVVKKQTSQFRGVRFCSERNKWSATITVKKKQYNLGRYDTEVFAVIAYNIMSQYLLKENGYQNKIPQEDLDKYYQEIYDHLLKKKFIEA